MNKKAFTLVELLAVIVVLAIVVVVAVPVVLSSLSGAKLNTFKIYAEKALNKAMEVRQSDELEDLEKGTHKTKNCYTLADLGLDTGGKYSGSVKYDAGTYTIYISDKEHYAPGLTFEEVSSLNGILTSGDTGFKNEANEDCS